MCVSCTRCAYPPVSVVYDVRTYLHQLYRIYYQSMSAGCTCFLSLCVWKTRGWGSEEVYRAQASKGTRKSDTWFILFFKNKTKQRSSFELLSSFGLSLCTFLITKMRKSRCRMSIVNITMDNIAGTKGQDPLTPNHLLTMKTSVPLPPPPKKIKNCSPRSVRQEKIVKDGRREILE